MAFLGYVINKDCVSVDLNKGRNSHGLEETEFGQRDQEFPWLSQVLSEVCT